MNVLKNYRYFSEVLTGINFNSRVFVKNFCNDLVEQNKRKLFFNEDVQCILKSLTQIDYEKIFRPLKLGKKVSAPVMKFMTNEELEQARVESHKKAEQKLQMPPVLPPREEINHILVKDKKLVNYSESKYVFTDITYGKDDRTRQIVVRDIDGTLRKASWKERELCNEIYFPRPGRKVRVPLMFKPGYFEDVLNRGWFQFILERACIQFEPDDPLYISVTERTYDKVAETKRFLEFESTRFYGPMIFYFTEKKNLAPLLIYFLNYDRLEDILKIIQLHNILHPEKKCSLPFAPGQELALLKAFITEQYPDNQELQLSLKSFEDYLSKPKSQAAI